MAGSTMTTGEKVYSSLIGIGIGWILMSLIFLIDAATKYLQRH